jgi:hypothetical protein
MRREMALFRAPCSEIPNDNPELHEGAVWIPTHRTGLPRAISRAPRERATAGAREPEPGAAVCEPEAREPEPGVAVCEPEAFAEASAPEAFVEASAPEAFVEASDAEPSREVQAQAEVCEPEAFAEASAPEPSRVALAPAAPEPVFVAEAAQEAEAASAESAPWPAPERDAFAELLGLLCRVAFETGATRAAAVLPGFLSGEVLAVGALGPSAADELCARGLADRSGAGIVWSASVRSTTETWRAVLNGQSDDLSTCEDTLDSWCAELVAVISGTSGRASELRRELRRHGVAAFGLLSAAA